MWPHPLGRLRSHAAPGALLTLVVAGAVVAQEMPTAPNVATGGTGGVAAQLGNPLDAGVEDADPLATSLRAMQMDLRDPVQFRKVYNVPGRGDMVMRADGALFAVFPRSVYAHDGRAIAPADTVYHIGLGSLIGADWWMPESDPGAQYPGRMDTSAADEALDQTASDPRDAAATGAVTTREDGMPDPGLQPALEAMRLEPVLRPNRVVELLRRAAASEVDAQAARGRSSSPSSK